MDLEAQNINELFLQKLDTDEGLTKVAQGASSFIREKIREVSFARKIINPQYVTQADCQRSTQHEGLVKIVDIEPDSSASVVNFRGGDNFSYVQAKRVEIPFYPVSSDDFQKVEEELLAYEMPVTDVIEKNSIKDIQKVEDENWISKFDSAITETGNTASESFDGTTGEIKKSSIVKLFNMLDGNELKADTLLMNKEMFNKLLLWDATTTGDKVGSEVIVNGYKYSTLFGRKLIVTNKTDVVGDEIYAFAPQEYLGKFYILNDLKFWVDKKKNVITWGAYETIGGAVANADGVAKIELS